jgi:hypothetical protein
MVCPHLAVKFSATLLGNARNTPGTARARTKDHRCGRRVGRTLNEFTVILDVGVTSCLTNNSGLDQGAADPGTVARAYERRKILAVHAHPVTMRGSWRYVPFILEDCGRPGVHALAFLAETQKLHPVARLPPGIRVAATNTVMMQVTSAVHQSGLAWSSVLPLFPS